MVAGELGERPHRCRCVDLRQRLVKLGDGSGQVVATVSMYTHLGWSRTVRSTEMKYRCLWSLSQASDRHDKELFGKRVCARCRTAVAFMALAGAAPPLPLNPSHAHSLHHTRVLTPFTLVRAPHVAGRLLHQRGARRAAGARHLHALCTPRARVPAAGSCRRWWRVVVIIRRSITRPLPRAASRRAGSRRRRCRAAAALSLMCVASAMCVVVRRKGGGGSAV